MTFAEWQEMAREYTVEGMSIDDLPDTDEYSAFMAGEDPQHFARCVFENEGFLDPDDYTTPDTLRAEDLPEEE